MRRRRCGAGRARAGRDGWLWRKSVVRDLTMVDGGGMGRRLLVTAEVVVASRVTNAAGARTRSSGQQIRSGQQSPLDAPAPRRSFFGRARRAAARRASALDAGAQRGTVVRDELLTPPGGPSADGAQTLDRLLGPPPSWWGLCRGAPLRRRRRRCWGSSHLFVQTPSLSFSAPRSTTTTHGAPSSSFDLHCFFRSAHNTRSLSFFPRRIKSPTKCGALSKMIAAPAPSSPAPRLRLLVAAVARLLIPRRCGRCDTSGTEDPPASDKPH